MSGDCAYGPSGAACDALATVLALLPQGLLCGAVATHHALSPLHLMPVCLLFMAEVAGEALPAAWEPQPPACTTSNQAVCVEHSEAMLKQSQSTGSYIVVKLRTVNAQLRHSEATVKPHCSNAEDSEGTVKTQ